MVDSDQAITKKVYYLPFDFGLLKEGVTVWADVYGSGGGLKGDMMGNVAGWGKG